MRFKFHPEASAEFLDAARYYGGHHEETGFRFVSCVNEAVEQITRTPSQWRRFDGDVRRCLTRVFPYAVLYSVESEYILILAVMHCHRKPGYWHRRIGR